VCFRSWLDRFRLPDWEAVWESGMDRMGEKIDDWWARRQERKAGKQ
jgi:hypothetical protein